MNAPLTQAQLTRADRYSRALAETQARTARIEYRHSWLRTPLPWTMVYEGPSVGGYGFVRDGVSKHATRERAEQVAAEWLRTGVIPAHQVLA